MRTLTHLALLALLSGISSVPAAASSFSGSTISRQYYAWGGVYTGRDSSGTFVDSGGGRALSSTQSDSRTLTSSQAPTSSSITPPVPRAQTHGEAPPFPSLRVFTTE